MMQYIVIQLVHIVQSPSLLWNNNAVALWECFMGLPLRRIWHRMQKWILMFSYCSDSTLWSSAKPIILSLYPQAYAYDIPLKKALCSFILEMYFINFSSHVHYDTTTCTYICILITITTLIQHTYTRGNNLTSLYCCFPYANNAWHTGNPTCTIQETNS